MTANQQHVVVCRLLDGQEMRGIAQAALEETVALITLDEPPPAGEFVLELHAPATRPVVVLAVTAGEPVEPMYPVRVRPFDDEHSGQLLAFVCSAERLASKPVTRWSRSFEREPSLLRLDTIPDQWANDFEGGERGSFPGEDPVIGRALAGNKYRIESLIGEGSAGAVYRGRHVALHKALAIKVLHPRFRADDTFTRRFLVEARAASRLDHPNVTRVQDFGEEEDGLLYIVMELLEGVDLRQLIHADKLPRQRRIEILISVLNALAAADDQHIVHRDIKPENVMVVESQNDDDEVVDVVKVCDFGLATVKPRTTGGTDIRQAAAAMSWVAGTPEYMSPEQILGEELDIRSDLYACGIILFELLTGILPFKHQSVMHLMRQQLYDSPPSLRALDPSIDARLDGLTRRAMSKDPDQRPKTPREFRNELREATRVARNATFHGYLSPNYQSAFSSASLSMQTSAQPTRPQVRTLPPMAQAREQTATPEQIADRIVADVPSVLNALTGESTAQQFVRRLRAIVSAFPVLLDRGAITPVADIALTLVRMAEEPASADDPRPGLSSRALEPLRHETRLANIANAFLMGPEETRDDAKFLLTIGGVAGLQAILNARRKLSRRDIDRDAFVSILRTLGSTDSRPLVSALTDAIEEANAEPKLVEDLLLGLPAERLPAFLRLAQRLVHLGDPVVRRTTMLRLPDLLGVEAHRFLRAATRDPDESVRIAAVESLRLVGGVDEAVIALARDVLCVPNGSSVELRVAVADALEDVLPEHRLEAIRVLNEALVPKSHSLVNVLLNSPGADDDTSVIVSVAQTLIAIAGMSGRQAVERRAATSRGVMRDQLQRLLG